jgi:multiple sugar transport system substrate-binding protein
MRGRTRRRPLLRVVAALALAALALLPGCAKKSSPKLAEVTLWQPWDPAVLAPHVARFEGANPTLHVNVRQVPPGALGESLSAALAAGVPPDLCVMSSDDLPGWLVRGVLNDWSAGVADLRDSLTGWPWCRLGDALYGLPWLLDERTLLRNDSLIARAGVKPDGPPRTWAQLRTLCARTEKLGHGIHGIGLVRGDSLESAAEFLAFACSNGAEPLSADFDSARFDSKPMRSALDYYLSLRHVGLVAGRDTLWNAFAAGRLAFLVADAATSSQAENGAAISLLPAPAADDTAQASYASGLVLVSFTGAKRKEAALRLARALVRPEAVRDVASGCGYQSVWLDSAAAAGTALAGAAKQARFAPAVAHWDSMRTAIGNQVSAALSGSTVEDSVLAALQSRMSVLVRRR